jgi:hypothetical protein
MGSTVALPITPKCEKVHLLTGEALDHLTQSQPVEPVVGTAVTPSAPGMFPQIAPVESLRVPAAPVSRHPSERSWRSVTEVRCRRS